MEPRESTGPSPVEPALGEPLRRALRSPRVLLVVYGVALALIAVWPVPVDRGASRYLAFLTRLVPQLTYDRIEFGANILLFLPLGVLLPLILHRSRYLVLPLAFLITVAIESIQALLLDQRTPSVLDIIANTAGACLGMVLLAAAQASRRARREQERSHPPAR
ncbi:MAG: VanZ family protein [Microbacterium sp.]|uniref:VanZ family protein n=1 Tax=Microbacterium sp. TaxID=51671 RepID=UPI00260198E9|nr:VanZ family protein [Microbacterium sp.]MCX6501523.1 VanZ family protein [Microbacterium sp.]